MIIKIGRKITVARAVEWTGPGRTKPICFILKCPYCQESQWIHIDELYRSTDGSINNYQCDCCGKGADRVKLWSPLWSHNQKSEVSKTLMFRPKNAGWRSIDSSK